MTSGAGQKASSSWNLILETYEGQVFSGKKRKLSSLHHDFHNWGTRPDLSRLRLEWRMAAMRRDGQPCASNTCHSPEGHGQDSLHLDSPLQHFLHLAFVRALFDLLSSN